MGMTIDEFEEYAKSHNILAMTRELYENRLKADLKAILVELQIEIREHDPGCGWEGYADKNVIDCIIQQKINELKQESTTKTDKVDCKHTDCNNCVNHKYCDYEPTTKNDLGVDCISREQAIEEADKLCLETGYDNEKVIEMLNELPSVTTQSRKGHWITHHESMTLLTGGTATGGVVCSECGYKTHNKAHVLFGCPYNYCPNCGTKMVEPQESEDV